ncbi:MAG: glycosyltransferase [Acidobacteriaceae bacterium]|nr:glycosyltransferase [Acidobacteriaceae bacterium]
MKILWVKTDFLHPTTRGGQIRTLEMLRRLSKRHEIHYLAFDDPAHPEGSRRSGEYSAYAHAVRHEVIPKGSVRFAGQLLAGLFSPLPVAGMRYRSVAMRYTISKLLAEHDFDAKICDFIFPSVNIEDLSGWIVFQHNVETIIWERHAKSGPTPAHRAYFALQARRMFDWEKSVCRRASHVVGVSELDERIMRDRFGIASTSSVPTGVDLNFFERRREPARSHDLVFVGSMDWMPNIDGMRWFLDEIFPMIRRRRPDTKLAIVGRNPPASLMAATHHPLVTVTGTVPDVRPYLWGSAISIVPLRVGGGTRLKIFEAMAAGTPVVSTTVGAEGLPVRHGDNIRLADTSADFAAECLNLLENEPVRQTTAANGLELIRARFSWEEATRRFEETLCSMKISRDSNNGVLV